MTADVFFPNRLTGNGNEVIDEPATLQIGSKEFAVERLPREAPDVDGLKFLCASF